MSDHGLNMFAIVEVRGGVAELTVADGIQPLHVDWDNIGDDWTAAEHVLDQVNTMADNGDLQAEQADRIKDGIEEVWPLQVAERHAWHFADQDCPEGGHCYGDKGGAVVTCKKCRTNYDYPVDVVVSDLA